MSIYVGNLAASGCHPDVSTSAHLQHGQIAEGEVSETSDVEECHFIGALLKVPAGQIHRSAQISHLQRHVTDYSHDTETHALP